MQKASIFVLSVTSNKGNKVDTSTLPVTKPVSKNAPNTKAILNALNTKNNKRRELVL